MKRIVVASLLVTAVMGDEIERIESIVKDVGVLRQKYETCREKLEQIEAAPEQCAVNEMELKARHQEILALQKEHDACQAKLQGLEKINININSERIKTAALQKRNATLEQELKSLHVTLKEAQNASADNDFEAQKADILQRYRTLETRYYQLEKAYAMLQKKQSPTPIVAAPSKETFPQLVMKPGYEHLQDDNALTQPKAIRKAKTYRVKHDAEIYDAPDGKVVAHWEARRSFTSTVYQNGWIKITGYFIERKWHSARNELLWIKAEDAIER